MKEFVLVLRILDVLRIHQQLMGVVKIYFCFFLVHFVNLLFSLSLIVSG